MPIATSNFLVPNGTFIVELIAFLIVLGVIGCKVLPPSTRRWPSARTRSGASSRRPTRPRPTPRRPTAERRDVLEQAGQQAREIVAQADRTADQAPCRAEAQAQADHDRIVQSADAEVAVARQAAVEEVTARVGEIVLAAAERVIGREIQAADHQDLIDEAIAAVSAEAADDRCRPPGVAR